MANEQNDGRNPPKLDRVNVGDAITADAWNQIVDRLNQPLDVSFRRPRRAKGGGGAGTPKTAEVVTSLVVQSGNLIWQTTEISYLEPD